MFAQFYDDFSDGDFTDAPSWSGPGSNFVVQSQRLKLDASQVNDIAYLTTPSNALNDASWEFFVNLDFNPSNTNYTRVYLVSDKADLSKPLNGYFVSIGNTADDVNLYKQSGSDYLKIIDGEDKRLDLPTVSIRIKVTRNDAGQWELLSDVGSRGTYLSEGTATDTSYSIARYFGIFCSYTATRSDKFYFDDFIVTGVSLPDNQAPTVDSVLAISANELLVTFTEYPGPETARNVQLYQVDHAIGYPTTASHVENTNLVKLSFDGTFSIGVVYTLSVRDVGDIMGNLMDSVARKFQYIPPSPAVPKDIIFTEIFADPSPAVGLPNQEFVELFNRSQIPYNLDGWQLTDGSSVLILKAIILSPGDYLIVAPYADELSRFGHVFSDEDFPSLNNTGDILMIRDVNDRVVDSVNYSVSWYKDDDRSSGGWSLELIDPENLCSDFENWTASENQSGGTPGKQNSVFANKPDLTGPVLLSAYPSNPTSLLLSFNERLEKVPPSASDISLTPYIEIIKVVFADESLTRLQLSLADGLQTGIAYTIVATATYDCSGNTILTDFNTAVFGLPVAAETADIVINEILFNPKPAGVDFVELVNNSQNFINLKNWSIGNEDSIPSSLKPVIKQDYLVRPGTYVVLTEDLNALKGEYPSLVEEAVLELSDLPAFNDDEGSVVVVDDRQNIIDYFHYTKNLHSPFIKDEQGVSLERIALDQPSTESQNWKSASSTVGFATPGYLNSNALTKLSLSEETVAIEPEAFVPVVGQPDFTLIRYKFDQGGYVANVKVFDDQGHFIKGIANNEVLGTEGALRWDGDRENGYPARTGYYMVVFEVFNSIGEVKTFRKRIAIAARF